MISAQQNCWSLSRVKIERIINEPSAALALHHSREEDATYMIIDFGGEHLTFQLLMLLPMLLKSYRLLEKTT